MKPGNAVRHYTPEGCIRTQDNHAEVENLDRVFITSLCSKNLIQDCDKLLHFLFCNE